MHVTYGKEANSSAWKQYEAGQTNPARALSCWELAIATLFQDEVGPCSSQWCFCSPARVRVGGPHEFGHYLWRNAYIVNMTYGVLPRASSEANMAMINSQHRRRTLLTWRISDVNPLSPPVCIYCACESRLVNEDGCHPQCEDFRNSGEESIKKRTKKRN